MSSQSSSSNSTSSSSTTDAMIEASSLSSSPVEGESPNAAAAVAASAASSSASASSVAAAGGVVSSASQPSEASSSSSSSTSTDATSNDPSSNLHAGVDPVGIDEKGSSGLLSLLGLTGPNTTPTPSPPPSHPYDGGLYVGALNSNSEPHGRGKLKLPSGAEVSGEWTNGRITVGVLTNAALNDSLHYEGELSSIYARHGKGMEWRLEDGEINRCGKWDNNILIAECPVPRSVLTEGAFLAQEDMLSKLEFILPDGTAARYEGSRNEAGEPHGQGEMMNAKGEVVRGSHWIDGAQDGEGFFINVADGEKYSGQFKNGFKHGYGTHLFPDGSGIEIYEGHFRLNRKHGYGKQRWADDSTESKVESPDGASPSPTSSDGELRYKKSLCGLPEGYEGDYHNGVRHGIGREVFDDGYIYEGQWSHDEQNGWGIEYTKSGKISACGRWKDSELKEWHAVPRAVIPIGTYLSEKAKVIQNCITPLA